LNATESGVIPIFSIISYLVSTTGEPKKAEKAARENLCGLTNTLTGTNHVRKIRAIPRISRLLSHGRQLGCVLSILSGTDPLTAGSDSSKPPKASCKLNQLSILQKYREGDFLTQVFGKRATLARRKAGLDGQAPDRVCTNSRGFLPWEFFTDA